METGNNIGYNKNLIFISYIFLLLAPPLMFINGSTYYVNGGLLGAGLFDAIMFASLIFIYKISDRGLWISGRTAGMVGTFILFSVLYFFIFSIINIPMNNLGFRISVDFYGATGTAVILSGIVVALSSLFSLERTSYRWTLTTLIVSLAVGIGSVYYLFNI